MFTCFAPRRTLLRFCFFLFFQQEMRQFFRFFPCFFSRRIFCRYIWHIFWPLKWTKWFFLKINVFQIWAENFVARNKKSQNFFSMEWPQVHPTLLVWDCHLLIDIYGGPYVENGRFSSFQNSAGVLVQPWNRIFTSKFEVLLICLKIRYPPRNLRNYVYFENIQKFWWKFWKIFKFWEFLIFFFFWKFLLDSAPNMDRFFDMSKSVRIFMCHMSEHQNFYRRQFSDA